MIKKLVLVAKGVAMGAADVVPGVSGGTIALLTGIYPRLINAITGVDIEAVKLLFSGRFNSFWKKIDGNFVLPLLIGILSSFALLAHPIKHAIEVHPIPTWSFFFGLIVASSVLVVKQIPNKNLLGWLWIIPGILFGFWISSQSSIPFPNSQTSVFIAGMIAICAMILPGISGSFILLLLGMYETLISAVATREITTLLIFILGAVIGLLVFSRVIKFVLTKYYQATLFFLSGLMVGSLLKVWPWKISVGSKTTNFLPTEYPEPQTLFAILMMLSAIVLVFAIEYFGKKKFPSPKT